MVLVGVRTTFSVLISLVVEFLLFWDKWKGRGWALNLVGVWLVMRQNS